LVSGRLAASSTASEMAMPSAAVGFRVQFQDLAAGFGVGVGLANTSAPQVCIIERRIGLLVVGHLDHVDAHVDAEHLPGQGQGAAPLAGAGLGGQALDARLGVVIGLGDGRVDLVRAGRRDAFVLVVDLRRRTQRRFQLDGRGTGALGRYMR
jgi:hypothetical protein